MAVVRVAQVQADRSGQAVKAEDQFFAAAVGVPVVLHRRSAKRCGCRPASSWYSDTKRNSGMRRACLSPTAITLSLTLAVVAAAYCGYSGSTSTRVAPSARRASSTAGDGRGCHSAWRGAPATSWPRRLRAPATSARGLPLCPHGQRRAFRHPYTLRTWRQIWPAGSAARCRCRISPPQQARNLNDARITQEFAPGSDAELGPWARRACPD